MGEGTPVVCLHGLLLGSVASWYFTVAPALADAHEVWMVDLRGHGRSGRPATGYDLGTLRGDLVEVLDALGLSGPVDLVGHSYGALVALTFAMAHPERVGRLVLVELPLPGDQATPLEVLGLEGVAPGASSDELVGMLPADLKAAVLGGGRRARRLLEGLRALTEDTTLLADVSGEPALDEATVRAVSQPTLLVYGEDSACRGSGEQLHAWLANSTHQLLPGGHFLPAQSPQPLAEAIAGFLHG